MLEGVGASDLGRRVGTERRQRVPALDPLLVEVVNAFRSDRDGPVALRPHQQEADAGMAAKAVDQPRIEGFDALPAEPSRLTGEGDQAETAGRHHDHLRQETGRMAARGAPAAEEAGGPAHQAGSLGHLGDRRPQEGRTLGALLL